MISAHIDDCCLLRRTCADVDSDGSHDPSDVVGIHALGPQPFNPATLRAARAHGAEVADVGLQRAHERRDIELVIVGEHADGVSGTQSVRHLGQMAMRPVRNDLVRFGKAGGRREHGPSVAHRHVVPEHFGHAYQRRGEVDGPENQHAGWWREHLDEHRDVGASGFSVGTVVAGHAVTAVERSLRVAGDDDVEARLAERAHGLGLEAHDELGAQRREDLGLRRLRWERAR